MDLSIVIPVHNEIQSIGQLLSEISEVTPKIDVSFEVIIVDDVSTDGSGDLLNKLSKKYAFLRVFHLQNRGGQTGAYQKAIEESKGEYILRMDGDLQDNPRDIPNFTKLISEKLDLVMGIRECRKHRKLLRLTSMIYDCLVVLIYDSPLHVNSSSFIMFKTKYLSNVHYYKNDHRYLPIIAMERGATKVKEIIVENRERIYGTSKYRNLYKIIFGMTEFLKVYLRIRRGKYKNKIPLESNLLPHLKSIKKES